MRGSKERQVESSASRIGVGLISLGENTSGVLEECRAWLKDYFTATFPAFEWEVAKEDWGPQRTEPLWLLDRARERMEKAGWQFSFIVTDMGDHAPGSGPSTTLSFSHSAAVICLCDFMPGGSPAQPDVRAATCCRLVLASFARLNGLPYAEEQTIEARGLEAEDPLDAEEKKALDGSLHSLADGVLQRGVKELRGLALYARLIFTHPMRILRTVFNHRPLRMVFSLGKLVFAATAALVLALLSTELWYLGVGINAWRLGLIAAAVLLAATVYVVFRQHLYVRRVSRSLSEQAAFFNLTSFLTVFSVLLALFIIIFFVTMLVTLGAYPRYIVEDWVMRSEVGILDYVRVSLLISSMAMVVGALGAGLEENQHFRQVMYTDRNR